MDQTTAYITYILTSILQIYLNHRCPTYAPSHFP